ncbi:MAG: response regulator transcription factor [Bifidobacteriaceae bacterium]|jgi:DNA-binding NarL/FixJ family response regulator|nr:response regulator transcription factor [Bifidobacteriaceae bacterium]
MIAPIRVVIADDQEMIRDGIGVLLGSCGDIEVVGFAGDGREAVEVAARVRPDVIVMDVRMPRMDGLQATAAITAAKPDEDARPRILILTTFDHDDYVYDALASGASGFMLKGASARELAEAVRVVNAGDGLLAPSVTKRLIAEFATRRREGRVANPAALAQITPREMDVLREVARGASNAEIAGSLYLSEQTVKTHVGHLLAKLGARDRTQAVVFAYENGVVGSSRPPPPAG